MKIVVLMGGTSMERDVSLATGAGVVRALRESGHAVAGLDPHQGNVLDVAEPARIPQAPEASEEPGKPLALAASQELLGCDAVFIALHGGSGEDGTLQALLDLAGVPYTGSGMLASALAMDKARAKAVMQQAGVPCPKGILLEPDAQVSVEALGGFPIVVKPNCQGSSVGVHLVQSAGDLQAAVEDAGQYGKVLVEEFIPGRELTVAVLEGEPLPLVEIFPRDGFYDYRRKYTKGETKYKVPAEVDSATARRMSEYGAAAYRALGCRGVARVDFRLTPEGSPYCLEVNTVPGMTETSLVPMAAQAKGISYSELVSRLLEGALKRK